MTIREFMNAFAKCAIQYDEDVCFNFNGRDVRVVYKEPVTIHGDNIHPVTGEVIDSPMCCVCFIEEGTCAYVAIIHETGYSYMDYFEDWCNDALDLF